MMIICSRPVGSRVKTNNKMEWKRWKLAEWPRVIVVEHAPRSRLSNFSVCPLFAAVDEIIVQFYEWFNWILELWQQTQNKQDSITILNASWFYLSNYFIFFSFQVSFVSLNANHFKMCRQIWEWVQKSIWGEQTSFKAHHAKEITKLIPLFVREPNQFVCACLIWTRSWH